MTAVFAMESRLPDVRALSETRRASGAIKSFNAGAESAFQSPAAPTVDQAAFHQLLYWLAPDPETAGCEYELIRRRLITIFTCRGCVFPDELADETIDRVARKLPQIRECYSGNPARYFYGVAKKIYMEYLHRTFSRPVPPLPVYENDVEELLQHLDRALSKLDRTDRELILNYYREDGRSKIIRRRALAQQTGLHMNALRLRVHRIRSRLRAEVDKCIC